MRAVVTAGGTREPIDDVRFVTNLSSGRFGVALARALARRGVAVTLLAGRMVDVRGLPDAVEVVRFGSAADLQDALFAAADDAPELLFMAAAVADYSPVPAEGKLRSDADELVIRMRRNPKLLDALRPRCGRGTFLAGFKLLSGVSAERLRQVATAQNRRARLDLTLANDLSELSGGQHPAWLVTPEGGAIRVSGSKAEVADALVDFCLRRRDVRWHRSERDDGAPPVESRGPAEQLLALAHEGGLLPGRDGNVTARADGGLWATPRGVDKSAIGPEDLVFAEVVEAQGDGAADEVAGIVRWRGEAKPSIDTAVHARLYRSLPRLNGLLHSHRALVLADGVTDFPWPCGTVEEADTILDALARAGWAGRWDGGSFALELVHHGWLVGVDDVHALCDGWRRCLAGWHAHLDAVGAGDWHVRARPRPIFGSGRVVGIAATFEGLDGTTVWVHPEARGRSWGDRVAERLADEVILAREGCGVADFWIERGWHVVGDDGGLLRLEPPTRRSDARPAASVCLLDPVGRQVLLGRRKVPPWDGWWAFPGGGVDPGETALEAALRELHEETGLRVEGGPPLRRTEVYVSSGDGGRLYHVTNLVLPTFARPVPTDTDELEARWIPLDEAADLRPMAAGTRRVLRKLAEEPLPAGAARS